MPEPRFGLSFTQLAASAAAAASAAFGASYLGVAGTIVGAAVASVIATVATAMYGHSLERSRAAVRRAAETWPRMGDTAVLPASTSPVRDPNAPAPDTRELPVIAPEPPREPVRRLRWSQIAVAAAAVLAVTLGTITAVEGVLGKPLSALLGGSDDHGTSLGSAVGGGGSPAPRKKAPVKPVTTPTPTPSGSSTVVPTPTPTVAPTSTPTVTPPTAPPPTPTETPTGTPSPTVTPTS